MNTLKYIYTLKVISCLLRGSYVLKGERHRDWISTPNSPKCFRKSTRIIPLRYGREGNWHLSRLERDAASRSSRRGRARRTAQGLSVCRFRDSWKLLTAPRAGSYMAGVSFLGWGSGSHRVRHRRRSPDVRLNRWFVADGDRFASIMKSVGLTLKRCALATRVKITRRSHMGAWVCLEPNEGWEWEDEARGKYAWV